MEISLTQHMLYVCPECEETQKSYRQWLQHLHEKHEYRKKNYKDYYFQRIGNRVYECLKCKRRFISRDANSVVLQLHHITHLPMAKVYQCLYCAFATAQQTEISAHLKSIHHKELQNVTQSKDNSDYRNPKFNPEFYMRFNCPLCKQIMNRFETWLAHINKAHKTTSTELSMKNIADSSNHYCLLCKRMFYTNDPEVLQRHRFTHLPYPEYYRCAYCTTAKSTKIGILRHFIEKHRRIFDGTRQFIKKPMEWGQVKSKEIDSNVRYVCLKCDEDFDNQENCRSHISSDHQIDIKQNFKKLKTNYYQCLKCKKDLRCNKVQELQKHYFSHIPYRLGVKCTHCN